MPDLPRIALPATPMRFARSGAGIVGLPCPANDNPAHPREIASAQQVLDDALRLFADRGLGAAIEASREAEAAIANSDEAGFARWYAICRVLDRRRARDLAGRWAKRCSAYAAGSA